MKYSRTILNYSIGSIYSTVTYCSAIPRKLLRPLESTKACDLLSRSFNTSVAQWQNANAKKMAADSHLFESLNLHPSTLKSLHEDFGYAKMSPVQHAVLTNIQDTDLLVRAKTGTGKTLAFLIAAVERALKANAFRKSSIPILILSPTRELATQIANEAFKLTKHHKLFIKTALGGSNRTACVRGIGELQTDILVATPGRLNDIINEQQIRNKLSSLQVLVFDEADQLLDMGFQKEIEYITKFLPKERDTFMFSATLSKSIRNIASETLRPNYKDLDTVPVNEVDTHMKIKQSHIVTPYVNHFPILYEIIQKHKISEPTYKIIVFFPTTKLVNFATEVFTRLPKVDVMQIHSKLTQQARTKVSDRFRAARSAILFTTDVSARGVDYPNVTLVLQVGLPPSRDQYIHRIGRTGRAGKEGKSILILSPYEKRYLEALKGLPVRQDLGYNVANDGHNQSLIDMINGVVEEIDSGERSAVFLAHLGYRNTL
ncbi:P-loop containing nucleoside triphosphate hydrolase protein [Globomyces pollinis-pini]|nr:P-loop containing nucleoside triphosphate hydrolase protein [Globomyces pollinis-pini]